MGRGWGRPLFYLHRPTALLAWPVERPYQVTPLFLTSFSQRFQFCHCFSSTIPLSIDLFFGWCDSFTDSFEAFSASPPLRFRFCGDHGYPENTWLVVPFLHLQIRYKPLVRWHSQPPLCPAKSERLGWRYLPRRNPDVLRISARCTGCSACCLKIKCSRHKKRSEKVNMPPDF